MAKKDTHIELMPPDGADDTSILFKDGEVRLKIVLKKDGRVFVNDELVRTNQALVDEFENFINRAMENQRNGHSDDD